MNIYFRSEPRGAGGQGRTVLATSVSTLVSIAGKVDTAATADETEDTPPCLAMHILCALVQDGSLAHDVVPHLSGMFKVCVENFSSTSWAIRNAALQVGGRPEMTSSRLT